MFSRTWGIGLLCLNAPARSDQETGHVAGQVIFMQACGCILNIQNENLLHLKGQCSSAWKAVQNGEEHQSDYYSLDLESL